MIELDFESFCNQDYVSDQHYQLYAIYNGQGDPLYIGISRQNIWLRWFGFGGHMIYDRGRLLGLSGIGAKIVDHLPDSLRWKIQLWTVEDCIEYCKDILPSAGRKLSIDVIEPFMIKKLSPILNGTYNLNPGKDTTPKSRKELDREKEIDDFYKNVFDEKK
jgi:hypothetical protein